MFILKPGYCPNNLECTEKHIVEPTEIWIGQTQYRGEHHGESYVYEPFMVTEEDEPQIYYAIRFTTSYGGTFYGAGVHTDMKEVMRHASATLRDQNVTDYEILRLAEIPF